MPQAVIKAPISRSFLVLNAHPAGCALNVQRMVKQTKAAIPGTGLGNVVVIGGSAGYGLASLIAAVFGHGAKALNLCFERPPEPGKERTGSAGWYNLAEVHRLAKAEGRTIVTHNGDAFSTAMKQQAIATLKERFGKVDTLVYSIASPRRTDPTTGHTFASVLKPIDVAYQSKSVNLETDQVVSANVLPASEAEIAATVKVMGGEDWAYWVEALRHAGLLAPGFRTVAYSYIGPRVTHPIYRAGTIGRAKDHLETTAHRLDYHLRATLGGGAWVSVNKALVTQAASAIPVVPLYISMLYRVMKTKGTHEGTCEQIIRLFREHIGPGRSPLLDEQGRIRLDDLELDPVVQAEVAALWDQIDSGNLATLSDYAAFKREFRQLFGFEVEGVDYDAPVEIDAALE